MVPHLLYAKDPDSEAVAVSFSLVPSFDRVHPQDFYEVVENERPDQATFARGNDYHFTFIIDRSGSM